MKNDLISDQKGRIMVIKRKLIRIDTPPGHQGFLGPDHTARAVIQRNYSESDPFIMLMDDIIDKQNNDPVGGPHPHAGFETVTLIIEGEIGDVAAQNESRRFSNYDGRKRNHTHRNNRR